MITISPFIPVLELPPHFPPHPPLSTSPTPTLECQGGPGHSRPFHCQTLVHAGQSRLLVVTGQDSPPSSAPLLRHSCLPSSASDPQSASVPQATRCYGRAEISPVTAKNHCGSVGWTFEAQGLCVDSSVHSFPVFCLSFLTLEKESIEKPGLGELPQNPSKYLASREEDGNIFHTLTAYSA